MRRLWRLLILLVFMAAVAGVAVAFNHRASWLLVILLGLFLLVNGLSLLPWLRWLTLTSSQTVYSEANKNTQLSVTLQSTAFFIMPVLTISLPEASSDSLSLTWYRGNQQQLTLQLVPLPRGVYQQFPVVLTGGDLFGFFQKRRQAVLSLKLVVLPAKVPGVQKLVVQLQEQRPRQRYGEPLPLVKNLRDYQQGDPLKRVDWKLSARQQALMVREYEQERGRPLTLIYWGVASPDYEAHLRGFYTLQQALQGQGFKFLLLGEGITGTGQDLEIYARLQPVTSPVALGQLQGEQLLVFPTQLEDEQFQRQLQQLKKYNQVTVFPPATLLDFGGES